MLYGIFICVAYIIGIIWGLNLLQIGLIPIFLFLFICMLYSIKSTNSNNYFILNINRLFNKLSFKNILIFFFVVLIGLLNTTYRTWLFKNSYTNSKYACIGEIKEFLKEGEYYNKYIFINDNKDKFIIYIPKSIEIKENSIVNICGTLKNPSSKRNKGGFDYSRYLYSQNIYSCIYINSIEDIQVIDVKEDFINIIRNRIITSYGKVFPKNEFGVLLGMTIGNTRYIDEETIGSFKDSGITHLLAVSGTNITYIIVATSFILNKILGKTFSKVISIFLIIIFVFVAGLSPSVERAGLMAIILIFSSLLSKKYSTLSTVAFTALLMLFYNPYIICDIGFILSFGGTLGIILFYKKINTFVNSKLNNRFNKYFSWIIDCACVTLSAQIILIPILIYYFNTFSVVSIITNVLVAPLIGVISVSGIVIIFMSLIYFPLAKMISFPIYILLRILITISDCCSSIPYGNIVVPTPPLTYILIYYFFIYIIFCNKEKEQKKKFKSLLFILTMISIIILIIPHNYIELNIIDVGQGDAIHIKTQNRKNILIDGGGTEGSDYDVGKNILVPYLLNNTNGTIDTIIVSHFHEDHVEGLLNVISDLKVNRIIIGTQPCYTELYKTFLKLSKEKNIPIYNLKKNDYFYIDGIKFEAIYPGKKNINDDLNNNSFIIKVTMFDTTLLLTGDAEIIEENEIVSNYKDLNNLNVDILKVAHHGSKGSSCDMFLEATKPKISVISCGVDNRYGHPHNDTLKRLNKFSKFIYRTDLSGEISFKVYKKDKIKVETIIK